MDSFLLSFKPWTIGLQAVCRWLLSWVLILLWRSHVPAICTSTMFIHNAWGWRPKQRVHSCKGLWELIIHTETWGTFSSVRVSIYHHCFCHRPRLLFLCNFVPFSAPWLEMNQTQLTISTRNRAPRGLRGWACSVVGRALVRKLEDPDLSPIFCPLSALGFSLFLFLIYKIRYLNDIILIKCLVYHLCQM